MAQERIFICPWTPETEVFFVLYSFTKSVDLTHVGLSGPNYHFSIQSEDSTDAFPIFIVVTTCTRNISQLRR